MVTLSPIQDLDHQQTRSEKYKNDPTSTAWDVLTCGDIESNPGPRDLGYFWENVFPLLVLITSFLTVIIIYQILQFN